MPSVYRRRIGIYDTWHFCRNCSNWPRVNYDEQVSEPKAGEICSDCLAKDSNGTCQEWELRQRSRTES